MAASLVELPRWLLLGLGLGALLTVLIAVTFAVGARVFPAAPSTRGTADGGEGRRRREIREYLRSIGEPFVEDHPIEGRTVAFFLPERDVAITFDARGYFVLERAGVHAILVEHELPGASLGERLPFETPEPRPVEDGVAAAFATLGLEPTASGAEVRRAYRERVKEVHPDQGGDAEAFERVREAYTVARKRAD